MKDVYLLLKAIIVAKCMLDIFHKLMLKNANELNPQIV